MKLKNCMIVIWNQVKKITKFYSRVTNIKNKIWDGRHKIC